MATAYEKAGSRQNIVFDGDTPEWDLEYCILEAADETEAYNAVVAQAPVELFGLTRKAVRQPPKLKLEGGTTWTATVRYVVEEIGKADIQEGTPTTFTLEFDTGGETYTRHGVKSDKQAKYSWSAGVDPAPDIKGALGFDGKKANGIEQGIPGLKLTLSVRYNADRVDANVIKNWSRNTFKVNSDKFLGFDAGELLHLGAKGTVTLDAFTLDATGAVPVSFVFQASENITGFVNIGEISFEGKGGWQHVDVVSGPYEDTTTTPPTVVIKPLYAYVSTIYESTSFRAMTGL